MSTSSLLWICAFLLTKICCNILRFSTMYKMLLPSSGQGEILPQGAFVPSRAACVNHCATVISSKWVTNFSFVSSCEPIPNFVLLALPALCTETCSFLLLTTSPAWLGCSRPLSTELFPRLFVLYCHYMSRLSRFFTCLSQVCHISVHSGKGFGSSGKWKPGSSSDKNAWWLGKG